MRNAAIVLGTLAALTFAAGCNETFLTGLPDDVQAALSSLTAKTSLAASPIRQQDRDRLHLMDGSGDGNQFQYGGSGGGGSGGGTGGNGDGDRIRLRDGSCGG
ncbi:MAG: hypothetical protein HRF50_03720 [Phycisphaerae bacterium]|jgi:uncharacterized membrane protein YgcG